MPTEYSPLEQNDEEYGLMEKLLGHTDGYPGTEQSYYKKVWSKHWAWFTHGALLCLSLVLSVLLILSRSEPINFHVYCEHIQC